MVWPTLGSRTAKEQEQEPMADARSSSDGVVVRYGFLLYEREQCYVSDGSKSVQQVCQL